MKKKIIKTLLSVLFVFIIVILIISYIETKNDDYLNNLKREIKTKLKLNEEITYTNQYGNFYIVTTNNNIIVLTKDYREILKENISKIKPNTNNYNLIYKTNRLMYEKPIINNNKLTYEYYDATTGELLKKTTMEKK